MTANTIPFPGPPPKATRANRREVCAEGAFADRAMADAPQPSGREPIDDDLFPPPTRPKSIVSRAFLGIGGVAMILLGIILAILPVVPGFPLIGVGVLMLVAASEHSRKYLNRKEHLLPEAVRKVLRKIVPHE